MISELLIESLEKSMEEYGKIPEAIIRYTHESVHEKILFGTPIQIHKGIPGLNSWWDT